jgi:hypothetical protein
MKFISFLLFTLIAISTFASNCIQLSNDGKTWDTNPFILCVEKNPLGTSEYKITLSNNKKNIAIYYLNTLIGGADTKVFGVNPNSGSLVDNSVTISIGDGEVMIGGVTYFYKNIL